MLPMSLAAPCRRRRLLSTIIALAGLAALAGPVPAAAGETTPRSRLHVLVPGYEAYFAPAPGTAAPPAPALPAAASTPLAMAAAAPDAAAPPAAASGDGGDEAPPLARIAFAPAETALPREAAPSLAPVLAALAERPAMMITVAGFAAATADPLTARRRALWRARAVRSHLLGAGIGADRIRLDARAATGGGATERVDVRIIEP